jgi:uncharacterized protein YjbI with pentapeptide repeats
MNRVEIAWARILSGNEGDIADRTDEGRLDLRGLKIAEPRRERWEQPSPFSMVTLTNLTVLRDVKLRNIDFSNSDMPSLRFHGCAIENCKFDGARCRDWRLWQTSVVDTTFVGASLRDSALAAIEDGKRNSYRNVVFDGADLRGTAWKSADVVDCRFRDATLTKVDFQGTVFRNCTFSGSLDEVMFYRHAFRGEEFPPNEMEGVDLSDARLSYVEFRKLDLEHVKLPSNSEHVVVSPYRDALADLISKYGNRDDLPARSLVVLMQMQLKWAGEHQRRGVISKLDLDRGEGRSLSEEVWSYLESKYGTCELEN